MNFSFLLVQFNKAEAFFGLPTVEHLSSGRIFWEELEADKLDIVDQKGNEKRKCGTCT